MKNGFRKYARLGGSNDRQSQAAALLKYQQRQRAAALRRQAEQSKLKSLFDRRGRPSENTEGDHGISQRQAAAEAHISEHQQLQAVRVNNVPEDEKKVDDRHA